MNFSLNRPSALKRAIQLLAKKDYSVYKLRLKLQDRGHSEEEINSTIDELVSKKYLKPKEYQESQILKLLKKGFSPESIQFKLSEEKITPSLELIYEIMAELNLTTEDQIYKLLANKKINPKEVMNQYFSRLQRYLYSKGHSGTDVDHIIQLFCHNSNSVL